MKIALVHELLTMKGGAERVLKILADMFPGAPIYTLLYDENKLGDWFPKERIRTSHLQNIATRLPLPAQRFNHHLYLPFFPRAVEAWSFHEYDVVLSSSSAFAHGIITNGKPKHLSYIHSPARYLWDRTHDVQKQQSGGILGPLKRLYFEHIAHPLRVWDSEAAERPDTTLAVSKIVQKRIQTYWRQESTVIHPPIDDYWLSERKSDSATQRLSDSAFFLVVSTLVPYKRIDIAIEACNNLKLPLKIVGSGPDRARLESIAGPTIEFLGYTERDDVRTLYTQAQATIFAGDEDFGLVPLESMACGTPVIAYGSGGALETVLSGETGVFFNEPTSQSLTKVLSAFDASMYSVDRCRARAQQFSSNQFKNAIQKELDHLLA